MKEARERSGFGFVTAERRASGGQAIDGEQLALRQAGVGAHADPGRDQGTSVLGRVEWGTIALGGSGGQAHI